MDKTVPLIESLIEMFDGNLSEIARQLNTGRSTITSWVHQGYIPERQALQIERVTDGLITCKMICQEAERVRWAKGSL